jgi:hypothetical protein
MRNTLPINDLLNLADESLYDYFDKHGEQYTKEELVSIGKKFTYIGTGETKQGIIYRIKHELAIKIIHGFLYPNKEVSNNYLNLDKVKKFDTIDKINFIKKFGKYLTDYNLKSLIYEEIKETPPSYEALLTDMYLKILKKVKKKETTVY